MPRGEPRIGQSFGSRILGTVAEGLLGSAPEGESASWEGPSGSISVTDPPPPWELADSGFALSDARRFVTVPPNLEVRWINPRVLDAEGWRDWQPVMASDERFEVRVQTMVSPEGNIRRGGPTGDILAFMPRSWVLSRRKQFAELTARQSMSAVNQQEVLREELRKGPGKHYVGIDGPAKHPTHTLGDGRTMTD